jgi:hypothetical protein
MALAEPVTIPFGSTPSFLIDVPLQSLVYRFKYKWSSRFEYWEVGIYDTQDNVLIEGLKIVLNYNIIAQYVDRNLPRGKIIPIRVSGETRKIEKEELIDGRVLLSFFEEIDDAE